jgi:hypothetical protein
MTAEAGGNGWWRSPSLSFFLGSAQAGVSLKSEDEAD